MIRSYLIGRDHVPPEKPEPPPAPPESVAEGVRKQRRHIEDLDGEDPLRGGVAD